MKSQNLELIERIKLNKTKVKLLILKAFKGFLAIGDSEGNIYIFKVTENKSRLYKFLIQILGGKKEEVSYSYSLFKIFKHAHDMEISGLEFITNSICYKDKIIL